MLTLLHPGSIKSRQHTAVLSNRGRLVLKDKGKSVHFTGRGGKHGAVRKSVAQRSRTARLAAKVASTREEKQNRHADAAAQ